MSNAKKPLNQQRSWFKWLDEAGGAADAPLVGALFGATCIISGIIALLMNDPRAVVVATSVVVIALATVVFARSMSRLFALWLTHRKPRVRSQRKPLLLSDDGHALGTFIERVHGAI